MEGALWLMASLLVFYVLSIVLKLYVPYFIQSTHQHHEMGTITMPVLQMRALGHREIKQLTEDSMLICC